MKCLGFVLTLLTFQTCLYQCDVQCGLRGETLDYAMFLLWHYISCPTQCWNYKKYSWEICLRLEELSLFPHFYGLLALTTLHSVLCLTEACRSSYSSVFDSLLLLLPLALLVDPRACSLAHHTFAIFLWFSHSSKSHCTFPLLPQSYCLTFLQRTCQ
jgi:hypothetical protein